MIDAHLPNLSVGCYLMPSVVIEANSVGSDLSLDYTCAQFDCHTDPTILCGELQVITPLISGVIEEAVRISSLELKRDVFTGRHNMSLI